MPEQLHGEVHRGLECHEPDVYCQVAEGGRAGAGRRGRGRGRDGGWEGVVLREEEAVIRKEVVCMIAELKGNDDTLAKDETMYIRTSSPPPPPQSRPLVSLAMITRTAQVMDMYVHLMSGHAGTGPVPVNTTARLGDVSLAVWLHRGANFGGKSGKQSACFGPLLSHSSGCMHDIDAKTLFMATLHH